MTLPFETAETFRRNKTRYCRHIDTKQWSLLSTFILPDAEIEFLNAEGRTYVDENGVEQKWYSRAGFVACFEKAFEGMQTLHVVDPGDFEVVEGNGAGDGDRSGVRSGSGSGSRSKNEARAVFGLVYHVGDAGSEKGVHLTGGRHYQETWKMVKDE
ncbi:hypothetical protein BDP55DRAFT_380681 [Colletotrichum godetiae]|uniref:SnoaL-like domain-containing protein n=1 Tax=Colletotrichum godetiae TaxID=1209918 RepID=A0AAJ0AUG0_9PEZI|nr:uncharacterized protein BDP55DRAFT_380681 [Colletotrichum godetiae]KAK1689837.1 hypothetical protein BDP55DRAFT_380681 [Colletotrichum godetiae]